jgi:hypothetical protein
MDRQERIDEKLTTLLKDTDFSDYPFEGHDSADDCIEAIREQINQEEVIYYSNAMEYLCENDASLNESMALAAEYGYTPDNINSELLASLLVQKNLNDALSQITDEIEEVFDEVDQEIEAEEEAEEDDDD